MSLKRLILLFAFGLIFWRSDICTGESAIDSLIPTKDIPDGWALIDGPHLYTKKNLFEHIDGQAELFFKYGFQKSVFAIYQNKKNQENQIELDIYDMRNVLQAFGIFSRFRNEEKPVGIGLDSYLDDRSAFFYKGKYFVMLYATESNASTLKQWAMKIGSRIVDNSPQPKEIGYFPQSGLKPGSIQYFPEGLLGHQFLKRGFKGTYIEKDKEKVKAEVEAKIKEKARIEDKEVQLFIAIFKDSQEALSKLKVYKDHLSKKGKVSSGGIIEFEAWALKGEDPYQGKVIVLQKGAYLLGVVGFEKDEDAEYLLAEFLKRIR